MDIGYADFYSANFDILSVLLCGWQVATAILICPKKEKMYDYQDSFMEVCALRPYTNQFEVRSTHAPISIRDQMIRAKILIERAHGTGLISKSRPLLVVGAGPSGVSAAMYAAFLHIETTLIDIEKNAFSRLAHCFSRWVCPTQYDWPISHWNDQKFPWDSTYMPLNWHSAYAKDLFHKWTVSLNHFLEDYENLEVSFPNSHITPDPDNTDAQALINVTYKSSGPARHKFGMILHCLGPGEEKIKLGGYSGFKFWDFDPYSKDDLGFSDKQKKPKILLAGGGDGILQDFLRLTSNYKAAGEIYNNLPITNKGELEVKIFSAEDQGQRTYCLNNKGIQAHFANDTINKTQLNIIKELRVGSDWEKICSALDGILKNSPAELKDRITIAFECDHFGRSYPLNRFLVLLINEYIKHKLKDEAGLFRTRVKIASIKGIAHTCNNSPKDCHEQDHSVWFSQSSCYETLTTNDNGNPEKFNAIILRFGINTTRALGVDEGYHNPNILLPYSYRAANE